MPFHEAKQNCLGALWPSIGEAEAGAVTTRCLIASGRSGGGFLSIMGLFLLAVILVIVSRAPVYGFLPNYPVTPLRLLEADRVCDPMLKYTEVLATYTPKPQGMPYGRILSPGNDSNCSRLVNIIGLTFNIPDGYFVVLAVEAEHAPVCFPKWPAMEPNAAFRTELFEGCPEGGCTLSLYALDQAYFSKVKEWFKLGPPVGMPSIPSRYRLDSVRIAVEDHER